MAFPGFFALFCLFAFLLNCLLVPHGGLIELPADECSSLARPSAPALGHELSTLPPRTAAPAISLAVL